MPKQNKPPKYCKMGKYAVVYLNGKKIYLGLYGSPESHVAYSRLIAEWRASPTLFQTKEEKGITVGELTAAYLDYAETMLNHSDYANVKTIAFDFLLKLYGGKTTVEEFTPPCLKMVRDEMIRSARFSRDTINRYISRIGTIF